MTTNLEADLRQEFDAASAPSSLTFNPDAVLRQGSRTIRRRRLMAVGSCAAAVALVATGATLMSGSSDTATPQPATRTTAPTGIVRAAVGQFPLTGEVEFNRDPTVKANVKFFASADDRKPRHLVVSFSTSKPGQTPDAIWKSGMVEGHPFTFGLVPGSNPEVTLADNANHGVTYDELDGTGYSQFAVIYKNGDEKEAARPAQIARITWSGPNGVVDGIEGNHRLSGRVLTIDRAVSVKVVLRPGSGNRSTVLAQVTRRSDGISYGVPLTVTPTDASGIAVVTGRYPIDRRITKGNVRGSEARDDGAPMATGILPPGASHIGVILRTGEATSPIIVQERMTDGTVIFVIQTHSGTLSRPSKSAIKAVTWTNADGTAGRRDVSQKAAQKLSSSHP